MSLLLFLLACSETIAPGEAPAEDPTAAWDATLFRVVSSRGYVHYDWLREDPSTLDAFVAWAAQPQDSLSGDGRLAFLVNAYNAFVIKGVLERSPLDSVRDVKVGLFAFSGAGFFRGLRFTLEGQPVSLQALEDELIREGFQDPRIHAAINCASVGCPPLRRGVYTKEFLDEELDEGVRRFLAERNRVEDGEAVFSEIFDWFGEDFTAWTEADSLCAWAADFDPAYAAVAEAGCPHRFEAYDWSLNAAVPFESRLADLEPSGWNHPVSDCPPFMDEEADLCTGPSPFKPFDDEAQRERLEALLATGRFGTRHLCERVEEYPIGERPDPADFGLTATAPGPPTTRTVQKVCAAIDERYTTCALLPKRPGCRVLQEDELRWELLAEMCWNEGTEACIAQGLLEAAREGAR